MDPFEQTGAKVVVCMSSCDGVDVTPTPTYQTSFMYSDHSNCFNAPILVYT